MTTGRILLLLAAPLFFTFISLTVQRRWPLAAAVIAGVAALFLSTQAAVGPGNQAPELFGGALSLTGDAARTLRFLYAGVAILFLLSGRWTQGSEFIPAGLATLSPVAAAMMAQSMPLGVVALLASTAFLTTMIQAGRRDSTLASLRYLTMVTLAVPFFVVAAWMLGSAQPVFTRSVWRLLLVGTALLLAGFPFHIWVRPVVYEAPPLATVFTFTVAPAAVIFLVFNLLQQHPILMQETPFTTWLQWSGTVAALTGGVLALSAASLKSLWGYLLLVEMGSAIVLASTGPAGRHATFVGLGLRFAGLLLGAIGVILLTPGHNGAGPDPARRPWWGWILFTYGALSLVGLPLTAGFPARWAALSSAAVDSPWLALLLLIAMVAAATGILRWLASATREKTYPHPDAATR